MKCVLFYLYSIVNIRGQTLASSTHRSLGSALVSISQGVDCAFVRKCQMQIGE